MTLTIPQRQILSKLKQGFIIYKVKRHIWIEDPGNPSDSQDLTGHMINGLVSKGVIDMELKLVE